METILRKTGTVVCRLPGKNTKWGLFQDPVRTVSVSRTDGILPALKWAVSSMKRGLHIAGFISYEASAAFDPANRTFKTTGRFPLLWLSSYKCFSPFEIPSTFKPSPLPVKLCPKIEKDKYLADVRKIKNYIFDGETYQVNYTFRVSGKPIESPEQLFLNLFASHPVPYSAFINTGKFRIISNSPELFLESSSGKIGSLPMKGTASRALTFEEDEITARHLAKDSKNCAENIMIVDMVRNDLGRICEPGSISAAPLFRVDTYPTVHQMVSGVNGQLKAGTGIVEILKATFPPASITGAPKIRAMEIISELESSPRKIYTGTIGCFRPNGDFCLNVAIRTFLCSKSRTELGIGSGIVADSEPHAEWLECLMKSGFANFNPPDFEVLETILWDKDKGFAFLDEHLARARDSQAYFGRRWDKERSNKALRRLKSLLPKLKYARVRFLVSKNGRVKTEYTVLERTGWDKQILKLKISGKPVSSKDVFLYHKTTNRQLYDSEFKAAHTEGFDEVIFMNEKGEITEGAITNIFILTKNGWCTPSLKCGLLPGIWRKKMICELRAEERNITLKDLKSAEKIIIGNSVRGGQKAQLEQQ
ncbi:MAG: aminodeoxychorismate synthase component I [Victivallales bacterium]|jgi:para-aminobenzoate synthetase/4-amino-4-deoxychorismate lyase